MIIDSLIYLSALILSVLIVAISLACAALSMEQMAYMSGLSGFRFIRRWCGGHWEHWIIDGGFFANVWIHGYHSTTDMRPNGRLVSSEDYITLNDAEIEDIDE